MPSDEPVSRAVDRDLDVLKAIAADQTITQRLLAKRLGIAVGLANLYLKRLVRKGYIRCINLRSNRLRYLLTPKGVAEKTRLTYEFMNYSLRLYGQARNQLRVVLETPNGNETRRIAIFGTGEAAELTYLCLREQGLEPVCVFDLRPGTFLGLPVRSIEEHLQFDYDVMVVATLDPPYKLIALLTGLEVDPAKMLTLRPVKADHVLTPLARREKDANA